MSHTGIALTDVALRYTAKGQVVEAVRDVNMDITPGEFVAIVGPSGCG